MIHTVNAVQLKRWLEKGEAVLIDVREPAEHRSAHIPAATLLPLTALTRSTLPDPGGKKLVVHCKAGKRGHSACEKLLREAADLDVYNLEGGIEAWAKAGLPVEKSGHFFLPLDRQVQVAAHGGKRHRGRKPAGIFERGKIRPGGILLDRTGLRVRHAGGRIEV